MSVKELNVFKTVFKKVIILAKNHFPGNSRNCLYRNKNDEYVR